MFKFHTRFEAVIASAILGVLAVLAGFGGATLGAVLGSEHPPLEVALCSLSEMRELEEQRAVALVVNAEIAHRVSR